jgi:glycosyltransferase involved in cell wall biosynthesis
MPLFDDEWARGKCAFKLIQYMACGIPVIGSAVGANQQVVTPECGFLVRTTEEWLYAFRHIRDNSDLRDRMGAAGRSRVVEKYSLASALPKLVDVIRRVAPPRSLLSAEQA